MTDRLLRTLGLIRYSEHVRLLEAETLFSRKTLDEKYKLLDRLSSAGRRINELQVKLAKYEATRAPASSALDPFGLLRRII